MSSGLSLSPQLAAEVKALGAKIVNGFPPLMARLIERDVLAITLGHSIFIGRSLDPFILEAIIRHELVHVRQVERCGGAIPFLRLYLREYMELRVSGLTHREAYRAISFEVEARQAESRVDECASPPHPDR